MEWPSLDDASPARFREAAESIRRRALWRMFWLLAGTGITLELTLFAARALKGLPGLTATAPGLLVYLAASVWALRNRDVDRCFKAVALMMALVISLGIVAQRGADAPAVMYALAQVVAVMLSGHARLGMGLACMYLVLVPATTALALSGIVLGDMPRAFSPEIARAVAFGTASFVIGAAIGISAIRRQRLALLFERALEVTERERDQARRLAERRAQLVAEISHEIRTPMTGIVGAAALLAREELAPGLRQLIAIQHQSAEHLLQLVNEVLDHARLESGRAAPSRRPFSLRGLIAEVAELYAPRSHRKGVELTWTVDARVPAVLVGDATRTRQIVSNLVSNAVKFTEAGEVCVHATVHWKGRVAVEVSDTGCGVEASRLGLIFERFVSAAADGGAEHSTGLGLAICKELARSMGGDVSVISTLGAGSLFTLDLPLPAAAQPTMCDEPLPALPPGHLWVLGARPGMRRQLQAWLPELGVQHHFVDTLPPWAELRAAVLPQAVLVDAWAVPPDAAPALAAIISGARDAGCRVIAARVLAHDPVQDAQGDSVRHLFRPLRPATLHAALHWAWHRASSSPPAALPRATAARPRVLLVDDNLVNQLVGRSVLERLGAAVTVVGTGEAAVQVASSQAFDLVLMDLQMPGLDGLAATRRLRMDEDQAGRARTPVVALTGRVCSEVSAHCRAAGMDAVMAKPYTEQQMRELLARSNAFA